MTLKEFMNRQNYEIEWKRNEWRWHIIKLLLLHWIISCKGMNNNIQEPKLRKYITDTAIFSIKQLIEEFYKFDNIIRLKEILNGTE